MVPNEPDLTPEAHVAADPDWLAEFLANLPGALRTAGRIALIHVAGFNGALAWCKAGIRAGDRNHSPEARAVEMHLGSGPCLYFYAGRCLPGKGGVAIAREPSDELDGSGWASPFDTGGIFRHLRFGADHSAQERIAYLKSRCRIPLPEWRVSFGCFLAAYFAPSNGYSAYWDARPRRDDPDGILGHPENTWRAWTYEVRYESGPGAVLTTANVARWCGTEAVVKALGSHFAKRFGANDTAYEDLFSRFLGGRGGSPVYDQVVERWARQAAS